MGRFYVPDDYFNQISCLHFKKSTRRLLVRAKLRAFYIFSFYDICFDDIALTSFCKSRSKLAKNVRPRLTAVITLQFFILNIEIGNELVPNRKADLIFKYESTPSVLAINSSSVCIKQKTCSQIFNKLGGCNFSVALQKSVPTS